MMLNFVTKLFSLAVNQDWQMFLMDVKIYSYMVMFKWSNFQNILLKGDKTVQIEESNL